MPIYRIPNFSGSQEADSTAEYADLQYINNTYAGKVESRAESMLRISATLTRVVGDKNCGWGIQVRGFINRPSDKIFSRDVTFCQKIVSLILQYG